MIDPCLGKGPETRLTISNKKGLLKAPEAFSPMEQRNQKKPKANMDKVKNKVETNLVKTTI